MQGPWEWGIWKAEAGIIAYVHVLTRNNIYGRFTNDSLQQQQQQQQQKSSVLVTVMFFVS